MKTYPTIKTTIVVEKFLSENHFELFSKAAIIRGLHGKINNNALTTILNYLEASNKIIQGPKGIQWIYSDPTFVKKLIKKGLEI